MYNETGGLVISTIICHKNIEMRQLRILAVVAIVGSTLNGCGEFQSNNFGSYAEAKKSELIGKGWIPEFIPKSAYEIKEQHRVDVARIHVELMFDAGDIESFESACTMQEEDKYICENSGYPVQVVISGGNYAVIKSIGNGT